MKRMKALYNGIIYSNTERFEQHALLIDGEKIVGIVKNEDIPSDYDQIDVQGANICPGLIDLQIYGTGEDLFSADLTSESLHRIEDSLLKQGCTTFYLTLATNTLEVFKEAIEIFKASNPRNAAGLHLEGPFLNPAKRGAHPEELIIRAALEQLKDLMDDDQGVVKIMTVAPELFADECIAYLLEKGVLISAGHSNATFDEATASFGKGIKTVTHLWNAMSSLHHRQVGLPGASYLHDKVNASIIVDGIHVDYEAVKVSKQMMGDRLFLITDAVAKCDRGIYQHILNEDHYVLPDGTLSGSALSMLKAIQNCVERAGIDLGEAIRMATIYPAKLMGRKDIGLLSAGMEANVLVFDQDFQVKEVYFQGEQVDLN